jgi:cytidylate kinase
MITIAIDGPCGAGKSTVAKTLSKKLNISYFNTGDIYRACAYYLINKGVEDPTNTEAINNTIGDANITVEFVNGAQRTILDGVDVTDELHTTKMNNYTMQSGNNLAVREKIVEIQRSTAKKQSVVMEGRDIGAVILPDANYKFFVTASVATRANRILKDLKKKGETIELEQVMQDVADRDYYDYHKPVGPLIQAEDSIVIQTDDLDLDGVIDLITSYIKEV